MKLIENTIDADQLQSSICNIDLEENMASCDLETMNGEQSKNEISPEKTMFNNVETLSKLSNGICNSPSKTNGFFDDTCDDDYQLVMESSSEDGGSPKKKKYDETISAPQLVQEIEDLLGINASNTKEELEKDLAMADDSEKEEDNLDDNQLLNNDFTQEVHNVLDGEEDIQEKMLPMPPKNVGIEKNCKITKSTDETECDSSNMNLVYDEIEIGTESVGTAEIAGFAVSNKNVVQATPELEDKEVIVTSISNSKLESPATENEATTIQTEDCSTHLSADADKSEESIIIDLDIQKEGDINSSQSTNKSENSEEWMVIDSIESEDEERLSQENLNNSEDVAKNNSQSQSTGTNVDKPAVTKSSESFSSPSVSSGGPRKRSASIEDHADGKKPKLEEHKLITHQENDCIKKSCEIVKRLSSEPTGEASKRSKLSEPVPVVNKINFKIPKQENVIMKKENKDDNKTSTIENCVKSDFKMCSQNCDKIGLDSKSTIATIEDDNDIKMNLNKTEEKVKNVSTYRSEDNPNKLKTARNEASIIGTHADQTMKCRELEKGNLNKSECVQQSDCERTDNCKLKETQLPLKDNKDVDDTYFRTVQSNDESKHLSDKAETNLKKSDENRENTQVSCSSNEISNKESSLMLDDPSNTGMLEVGENKLERKEKSLIKEEEKQNIKPKSFVDSNSKTPSSTGVLERKESKLEKKEKSLVEKEEKQNVKQKSLEGNCSKTSSSNTGALERKEINLGRKEKSLIEEEEKQNVILKSLEKNSSKTPSNTSELESKEIKLGRKENSMIKEVEKQNVNQKSLAGNRSKTSSNTGALERKEINLEKKEKSLIEEEEKQNVKLKSFEENSSKTPSNTSELESKEIKLGRKENSMIKEVEKQNVNQKSLVGNRSKTPSSAGDLVRKESKLERKDKSLIGEKEKQNVKAKSLAGNSSKSPIHKDKDLTATNNISTPTTDSKDTSSLVKELKLKLNGQFKGERRTTLNSPFEMLNKNMAQQNEAKQLSTLEKSIEEVVTKVRLGSNVNLPVLKKFHKNQLRRLNRTQLEETVVLKICEAITDRSDIGQMRLRCQSLEQSNELWKKKAAQFEKQNRELEMVLKRFMSEVSHLKKDNQNKVVLPIKVTRSVGLQVVLASSVHGALVATRNKSNTESSRKEPSKTSSQQQQSQPLQTQTKSIEKELIPEPQKMKTPVSSVQQTSHKNLRGRPQRLPQSPGPSSSTLPPVPAPTKVPVTIPLVKPATAKTISTPTKDLEVIDLTDREEKSKLSPPQVGGTIRVTPPTQVCFVQSSSPNTATPPMAYLVQKAGQRQQYLVATSSPSPPRPVGTINTRQPPALTLPVFRTGGQIIPVQTSTPGGVRTSTNTMVSAVRPLPQAIRLQTQHVSMIKHPAPLPSAPHHVARPGYKVSPPRPQLKIAKTVNGIMLSWSMTLTKELADMASYQLYAYQEGLQAPSTNLWKKVGDVKALPLPMACTLTQFMEGHRYHFAVRAVDVHGRIGPFSHPSTILLSK